MSGIKPDQFDYNAAVDRYDKEGFDWSALAQSTADPGFADLTPEQRQHVWDLLQVKSGRAHGLKVEPYAASGEQSALRQIGTAIKSMIAAAVPTEPGVFQKHTADLGKSQDLAVAAYVQAGASRDAAVKARKVDMEKAGGKIVQQFGYYFSGGLIPAPTESADPYVKQMMDEVVKPATAISAVVGQVVAGNFLLGLVSKVPLISSAAENLSSFTRGMIKTGILDFGINAAWPEGLSVENRIGISDNISRFLAPENVIKNPSSPLGRMYAGVGGMVEGALLGSVLTGFSTGVKLADAKYAFSVGPEMLERVKQSLEAAGVDVAGMTRRDIVSTYKTRLSELVQGRDEAIFNGQRSSAEEWIAQAFLHDPNITELTPAEGRLLYGIFSNNKGGISVINSITDPEAAIRKLRQVGINVDATVLPRRSPGMGATNADIPVPAPTVSDAELDKAVELLPTTSQEDLGKWWNDLSDEAKSNIAGVKAKDKGWTELDNSQKAQFEAWFNNIKESDVNVADQPITDINQAAKDARDISRLTRGPAIEDITAPEVGASIAPGHRVTTADGKAGSVESVAGNRIVVKLDSGDLVNYSIAELNNEIPVGAKSAPTGGIGPVEQATRDALHQVPETDNMLELQAQLDALRNQHPDVATMPQAAKDQYNLIANKLEALKQQSEKTAAVDKLVGKATAPETPTPKRKRPTKAEVKAANDRAMKAERRATDAEREAQTDGLTGLHNQKSWKATQARVDADPNLEVVSMDLSDFKALNDEIGHEAGDLALQRAAQAIQEANKVIGGEQAFRLGGDEFVMVVPKGQGQQALELAQKLFAPRITELVKDAKIGTKLRGGVGATYKEADAAERLMRAADKIRRKDNK